jgi:SAM-dependent methyltransferase
MDPDQCSWLESGLMAEHVERYRFACGHLNGDAVLDIACGSGFGTRMLAEHAVAVTGADLSAEAVAACRQRPEKVKAFEVADATALHFVDESFDSVVSFETLEHVPDTAAATVLAEFARVLRPGGRLILSTPDRRALSLGGPPANPYHTREFTLPELLELLARDFDLEFVCGQKICRPASVSAVSKLSRVFGTRSRESSLWRVYQIVLRRDAAITAIPDGRLAMVILAVARRRTNAAPA